MQKTVSLLTAEAEYYSASEMAIKVLYVHLNGPLRCFISTSMGLVQAPDTPVYADNAACIEWGNHVIGGRERAKHIDIRKHFAHETIQNRQMRLIQVETSSQLADIFTKPLQLQQFLACRDGLLTGQRGLIDRKGYTVLGYSDCDSCRAFVNALLDSSWLLTSTSIRHTGNEGTAECATEVGKPFIHNSNPQRIIRLCRC